MVFIESVTKFVFIYFILLLLFWSGYNDPDLFDCIQQLNYIDIYFLHNDIQLLVEKKILFND